MVRRAITALLLVLGLLVPHRLCARDADRWYRGDVETQVELARGLEEIVARSLEASDFPTGSPLIDAEWVLVTYTMAGTGLAQIALEHPERREALLPVVRRCVARAISAPVRAFDTAEWRGDDALLTLDSDGADHASYLGYLGVLLGFERLLDPHNEHAALHDRVVLALARRYERAPSLLLETYKGVVFPVDNTAAMATLALHDRATGGDHRALLARICERLRRDSIDGRTGLLRQTMPGGAPRGSGTALAAYFLSFVDPSLSGALFSSLKRELRGSVLGFGAIREYPRGDSGAGDVDSGPLVFGFSIAATGFAIGAARAHDDADLYASLLPTAHLFGAPITVAGTCHYTSGGPIGNAILLAMLTAPRPRRP